MQHQGGESVSEGLEALNTSGQGPDASNDQRGWSGGRREESQSQSRDDAEDIVESLEIINPGSGSGPAAPEDRRGWSGDRIEDTTQ